MITGGAYYPLGALESFRDGPAALECAQALDAFGSRLYAMAADQVRANYHLCRGEIELANRYRERVEMHAIQGGSGWQAEIWATASAILPMTLTRDVIGMKRHMQELERLAQEVPSLWRHARMARGSYHLLRGEAEQGRALYEDVLRHAKPREFMGWGAACAGLSRCFLVLGNYQRARQVAEEALARLTPEDMQITAMYQILVVELAGALAHLGELDAARALIEPQLRQHAGTGGPFTLGVLHRTLAEIAVLASDRTMARQQLAEMQRYFVRTNNPALLAQCETVKRDIARMRSTGQTLPPPSETSTDASELYSVLANCKSSAERAARALELMVRHGGGFAGYLYCLQDGEPALIAPLHGQEPPRGVDDAVRAELARWDDAHDRTEASDPRADSFTPGRTSDREVSYRAFVLHVTDDQHERVVGAIVIALRGVPARVDPGLLETMTRTLVEAGDLGRR